METKSRDCSHLKKADVPLWQEHLKGRMVSVTDFFFFRLQIFNLLLNWKITM